MTISKVRNTKLFFWITLAILFPTHCFAEVCDKLRPSVQFLISPVDGTVTKALDQQMTTWVDYVGDLFFQSTTPLPIIAIISISMYVFIQRKVLLYVAFITSLFAVIKLLLYVFEEQDDDLQFAMWEGCVLLPYGTFVILAVITIIAGFRIFKQKSIQL